MHVNVYNVPCWFVLGHRVFVLEKIFEHCKSYPVVVVVVVVAVVVVAAVVGAAAAAAATAAAAAAAVAVAAVAVVCYSVYTLHHMSSCFSTQFTLRIL